MLTPPVIAVDSVAINAWTGEFSPRSTFGASSLPWVFQTPAERVSLPLVPPAPANLRDWNDPNVGWGLVLPDKPGLSERELANGSDAPEPIQQLLLARGNVPVLRWVDDPRTRNGQLRNYRSQQDLAISGSPRGRDNDAIPLYLLIYASPEEIPWSFQYALNGAYAVGRLTLRGEALERYVSALLNGWKDAQATPNHTVTWAVDFGGGDITSLMRTAIAEPVHAHYAGDMDIGAGAQLLTGDKATHARLRSALIEARPGMIVTTSHGQTGPLGNVTRMRATLGLPVDAGYMPLPLPELLGEWQPDGAVWYAHACCSAGGDARTLFNGLFDAQSQIDQVLQGVAQAGAVVAPLAEALLGAKRPARAFIGHVEPTFDWTLKHSNARQVLTSSLVECLYNKLFLGDPVGLAFRRYYDRLAPLYIEHQHAVSDFNQGMDSQQEVLRALLVARDIQSTVILGDPTVALPPLN